MSRATAESPTRELETETLAWRREILEKSLTALRFLKDSFNADTDWAYGLQAVAHGATSLFYMTDEAQEGRDQFLEKRDPDWSPYPWYY